MSAGHSPEDPWWDCSWPLGPQPRPRLVAPTGPRSLLPMELNWYLGLEGVGFLFVCFVSRALRSEPSPPQKRPSQKGGHPLAAPISSSRRRVSLRGRTRVKSAASQPTGPPPSPVIWCRLTPQSDLLSGGDRYLPGELAGRPFSLPPSFVFLCGKLLFLTVIKETHFPPTFLGLVS